MDFEALNLRGDIDKWARFTIERWRGKQRDLAIGVSGHLSRSMRYALQMSGRDVTGVSFSFPMYGRFVDMGVGRGLRSHERSTNVMNRNAAKSVGAQVLYSVRKPKRWFNKPKMARIYALKEMLAGRVAAGVSTQVSDNMGNLEMTVRV